ncbi:unnamed protein product, partial [Symbiodinium sp. CCMP2592]
DVSHKRRYALVGVLVVPVDAQGKPVLGEDQEQASGEDKDACVRDVDPDFEELQKDVDEWFGALADDASEVYEGPEALWEGENLEAEVPLEGERLDAPEVGGPEDAWAKQQSDYEKEAEGMAWREVVFVELLDRKTPQSVCLAVGRIHAQLVELGFPLARIHADAGTEFTDERLREYAASRGILLTLAPPTEHDSNGRVENVVKRLKVQVRVYLQLVGNDTSKWALAFRAAAATWRADTLRKFGMAVKPIVPFGTRTQVLVRHWLRRRQREWHMRATPAVVLAPATYVRQGYVVKVGNKLSVVSKLHFGEESDLQLFVGKGLPPIAEPGAVRRRMRGKVTPSPAFRIWGKRSLRALRERPGPGIDEDAQAARLAEQVPFDCQAAMDFVLGSEFVHRSSHQAPTRCLGGVHYLFGACRHGGVVSMTRLTKSHPGFAALLSRVLHELLPDLTFTTVSLSVDAQAVVHKDTSNDYESRSGLVPLQVPERGGRLWTALEVGEVVSGEIQVVRHKGREVVGQLHPWSAVSDMSLAVRDKGAVDLGLTLDDNLVEASCPMDEATLSCLGDQTSAQVDGTGSHVDGPCAWLLSGETFDAADRQDQEDDAASVCSWHTASEGEVEQAPWDLSELTAHIEELDRAQLRLSGFAEDRLARWLEHAGGSEAVDTLGDTDLAEVQGAWDRVHELREELKALTAVEVSTRASEDDGTDTVLQTRTVSLPEVLANWEVWEHPANKEISALVDEKRALIPVDWKQVQRWKDSGKRVITIPAKAVWTIKAPDGRHKCRIVACGNMAPSKDESRQDHKDAVFASSLDVTHLRCALAVAARRSYEIAITDIRTAFLNAELLPRARAKAEQAAAAAAQGESVPIDEIVILIPPRCLVQRGLVGKNTLWQVAKAIYGLDTSPRDWSLSRDFSLRRVVVKYKDQELRLFQSFADPNLWLIAESEPESYIKDLADRYSHELQKVKHCGTPLGPGVMEPEAVENIDSSVLRKCQRLIGEILWVSVRTRPDVSFSISKLAQWMNRDPSRTYQLGLHVLAYLVDSANVGLVYLCSDPSGPRPGRKEVGCNNLLEVLTDSSFAPDAHVYLLAELAQKAPRVHIYNDNQAAVSVFVGQNSHWRTRSLRIKARTMRERWEMGFYMISHIEGLQNGADLGTKPLGAQRVKYLCSLIGVQEIGNTSVHNPKESQGLSKATLKCLQVVLLACMVCQAEGHRSTEVDDDGIEWMFWIGVVVTVVCCWEGLKFGIRTLSAVLARLRRPDLQEPLPEDHLEALQMQTELREERESRLRARRRGLPVQTTEPELEPASQQVPTRVIRYLDDAVEIPVSPSDDRPAPHVRVLSFEEARQQAIRANNPQFFGTQGPRAGVVGLHPDRMVAPAITEDWQVPVRVPLRDIDQQRSVWGSRLSAAGPGQDDFLHQHRRY